MKSKIPKLGEPSRDAQARIQDAVASWETVRSRLAPVIGENGFRVLFARSLHKTRPDFPWLVRDDNPAEPAFVALRACFEGQAPERVEAADRKLVAAFIALLNDLIGATLTARLLPPPPRMTPSTRPAR